MSADENESRLARWSRRKVEARQGVLETEELPPQAEAQPAAEALAELPAEVEVVLTDADMPPLESLNEDSDFSGFMSAGVSDELRNLALRKLFSAATFNVRDGLDEYDEDYTSFEKLGDIVTCDMKHQIELEEEELRQAALEQEALEAEQQVSAQEESAEQAVEDEAVALEAADVESSDEQEKQLDEQAPLPEQQQSQTIKTGEEVGK